MSQPQTLKRIACGNRKHHGTNDKNQAHHHSTAEVRECFSSGGILSIEDAALLAEVGEYVETMLAATTNELRPTLSDGERETYRAQYAQEFLDVEVGQADLLEGLDFSGTDQAPAPKAETVTSKPASVQARPDLIPDGIYTIEDDTLSGGYKTIRIRTQAEDEDFAPGKRIVAYLSGANNGSDYTGFAFLNGTRVALWKSQRNIPDLVKVAVLMEVGDPRNWLVAGHCHKCHRMLTTPESQAAGIGPVCAGKVK